MGQPKHLLTLPDGRTMPQRAADVAAEAGASAIVVVLGADAPAVAATLDQVHVAINDQWEQGMGGSIRVGLEAVLADEPDAVLILLADQPRVEADDLRRLIEAGGEGIAASRYDNAVGVPAYFGRRFFPLLLELPAAVGAKQLLRRLDDVALVELPHAADDVDTPADARLLIGEQTERLGEAS